VSKSMESNTFSLQYSETHKFID